MTAGEASGSRGGPALGSESERAVERQPLGPGDRVDEDGDQPAVGSDHDVAQRSQLAALPCHSPATQGAERESARPVERELVLLEQTERGLNRDRAVLNLSDRQRQETVYLVAADDVEADCAKTMAIEQEVDRPAELDPAHAYRQRQQIVSRM